jgi:hypothetical protein
MPDYLGEESTRKLASGELSGLSIYQPGRKPGQGEFPRFFGFCACFLEVTFGADATSVYILCIFLLLILLLVVLAERMLGGTGGR